MCAIDSEYSLLGDDGSRYTDSRQNWADILICQRKSGGHALSMFEKQVASVGCPTWDTEVEFANTQPAPPSSSDSHSLNFWSVYLLTSDAGSDQVKSKQIISEKVAELWWVLDFCQLCWLHQLHLVVRTLLVNVDVWMEVLQCQTSSPKYYSTLSSLSNTLREYSSRIRRAMLRLFPTMPDVEKVAAKIAPRCLVGRWA